MTHEVRVKDSQGNHKRTVFSGTEEDARQYLVDNFPRIHVEPGVNYGEDGPTPDAILCGEDGSVEHFNGREWVNPNDKGKHEADDDSDSEV